jgi:hypothetical protein
VLARLSKTLSTNVAIAGLTAVVLGAGGATASLAASHSPSPKPDTTKATDTESPEPADTESPEAADAADAADEQGGDTGTRPTDTHGYCVSQVAKAAPTAPSGTGDAKVTHGTLVSAAAQACGKETSDAATPAAKTHGKAFGKNHGTGRPAAVTPGASAR